MRSAPAIGLSIVFGFLSVSASIAGGDPVRGKRIYFCGNCHVISSERSMIGPSLQGIVGRKAATRPGYAYSRAMMKAGADGLVWTEADLADFIRSPRTKVPGTMMIMQPVTDEQRIADIIAYLKADPRP